jgi:hypothetical protein
VEETRVPGETTNLPHFTDKLEYLEKPQTCHISLTNFITGSGNEYTLAWTGFKLAGLLKMKIKYLL